MREALAQRLMEVARDSVVENLTDAPIDPAAFEAFFLSLKAESDRAVAIVVFSYVDDIISGLIGKSLSTPRAQDVELLFGPFGPLGSASSRIRLAAALDWISPVARDGLDGMRRVRNAFAHEPLLTGFAHERITRLVGAIPALESPLFESGEFRPHSSLTPREQFIVRCAVIAERSIRELATAPRFIRAGLPGATIESLAFDRLPSWSRALMTAVAGVALDYCRKHDDGSGHA